MILPRLIFEIFLVCAGIILLYELLVLIFCILSALFLAVRYIFLLIFKLYIYASNVRGGEPQKTH